jgi:hypothetical protein
MRRIILSLTTLFFFTISFAQGSYNRKAPVQGFLCSYYGEPINTSSVMGFASSTEAKSVINEILKVVGLQPSFEIRSANIPNAAAIISSGKRYILYNPQFVAAIDRAAGNQWASIAILAHEIGHHLNGHTLMGVGSQPTLELEADEFSGFVLRKMGASLTEAQSAMKIAADVRATSTHPAKDDRLTAIAEGWYNAGGQAPARNVAKAPSQPVATPRVVETTNRTTYRLDERLIAYDVVFASDQNNTYYVTKQNNVVAIKGNSVVVIGRVAATGNRNYPLKITDDKTTLFVSGTGAIVAANGRQVGRMQQHV